MKRFSKAEDKQLNGNLSEGGEIVDKSKWAKAKYKTGRWTEGELTYPLEIKLFFTCSN